MRSSLVAVRAALAVAISLAAGAAEAAPEDLVARPLTLDAGELEVRLTAEISIHYHRSEGLVSLAPDAWFGVAPRWTVGVTHSNASLDRIDSGASLCVSSSDICDHVYRGSTLDVRYGAIEGPFAVAPRVRAVLRDIDPVKPAVALGALLRWTRSRFSIMSDPYLRVPLANRKLGNRSSVVVPLWLAVQPATGWQIALHVGYDADVGVLRDGWHGPVGLAVTARVVAGLEATVEAGWAQLLGPQHDAKTGTILVGVGWRR